MRCKTNQDGFTLVELLVAMVISAIVTASVYAAYASQQRSYVTQDQLAIMQQNLRNSLYYLEQEIRMAGYDPRHAAHAGLTVMNDDEIRFTMDLNGDKDTADPDEDVAFDVSASGVLQRNGQPIAENIDQLNFVYLDQNRAVTAAPAEVRTIQVMVVARTDRPDHGYHDATSYTNQQGTEVFQAPAGDHFRRNALCVEVKCRNLGL